MKQMKPKSAQAFTWFAAILILAGSMIMSPSGIFFLFLAAAFFVVFPAIFGSGKIRVTAAALLLLAILLAAAGYPNFKSEQAQYRNHTRESGIGK